MSNEVYIKRYASMVEMRHFDEACMQGAKTGEIHGELHLGIGQEAVAAGMVESLHKSDALVSTHRNHFHALAKGVSKRALMAEIFEKESGLCRGRGGHMHPFDLGNHFSATGIVGASLPVALGYAYTFALKGSNNVAVAIVGDGGSNHGTFHESLNIAAAWKLPLLVVVENNHYGISVKADSVLATQTIAERASAYQIRGESVDGVDVNAVADAFSASIDYVRSGKGAAILEAVCHRFRGHFEGDLGLYRAKAEVEHALENYDPIKNYYQYLIQSGIAEGAELDALEAKSLADTEALLADVRMQQSPKPEDALLYRFVEA